MKDTRNQSRVWKNVFSPAVRILSIDGGCDPFPSSSDHPTLIDLIASKYFDEAPEILTVTQNPGEAEKILVTNIERLLSSYEQLTYLHNLPSLTNSAFRLTGGPVSHGRTFSKHRHGKVL